MSTLNELKIIIKEVDINEHERPSNLRLGHKS
jgi:hypothetical protein